MPWDLMCLRVVEKRGRLSDSIQSQSWRVRVPNWEGGEVICFRGMLRGLSVGQWRRRWVECSGREKGMGCGDVDISEGRGQGAP